MKYRRVGRSGLLVSELSLGTNTFGGSGPVWERLGALDQAQANAITAAALEGGVNLVDTADIYGGGESEQRIGQALRDLGVNRSDVVIATKVGGRMGHAVNDSGSSRVHLMAALDASLKRLGTDHVDILMVHFPDPATPIEETLRTLDGLVRDGKVRYIGCSNYPAWLTMKAIGISERELLERFVLQECHWSAATREVEVELVPCARANDLGLLIWGGLLGGLLTGKFREEGAQGRTGGAVPATIDEDGVKALITLMGGIAERHDAPIVHVALAWLLAQPQVSSVLFGARTPDQVRTNLAAGEIVLSSEDIDAIGQVLPPRLDHGRAMVQGALAERRPYA